MPTSAPGLTLVEVLTALAILALILGSMLVTCARLAKLSADSAWRAESIVAVDQRLSEWWVTGRRIPVSASGWCGTDGKFAWRTARVGRIRGAEGLEVIRLTLTAAENPSREGVRVEIVQTVPSETPLAEANGR